MPIRKCKWAHRDTGSPIYEGKHICAGGEIGNQECEISFYMCFKIRKAAYSLVSRIIYIQGKIAAEVILEVPLFLKEEKVWQHIQFRLDW